MFLFNYILLMNSLTKNEIILLNNMTYTIRSFIKANKNDILHI